MDCRSDGVGIDTGLVVSLSLGSPSSWVLNWFWKGMEKVVPQPVCSSKGDQNLVARMEDPDQVQGPVTCGWRKGQQRVVGLGRLLLVLPVMSVCLSRLEYRFRGPVALGNQVRPKGRVPFQRWKP